MQCTHRNKVFGPQNPENDENDENGGCHSSKPWFTESGVFTTPTHVHEFSARNSGAGNGCASLWAPGIFWFFLLENPLAHKIPRFRGGGGEWAWKCQFYFMGVGIFRVLR